MEQENEEFEEDYNEDMIKEKERKEKEKQKQKEQEQQSFCQKYYLFIIFFIAFQNI